ncbi:MAG TPA: response regulator [Melioribacteraceae bacterium]|nr:response regulator [Melioribacteraceae bacterium]
MSDITTLLVVEDDPFTRQFYDFLFSKFGFNLIQTEDGDEVFKVLNEKKVDLVIMDINLKNTFLENKKADGVIITRKIKEDPQFNNIPVMLVTAYQKKGGERNYLDDSLADDYIVKPITDYNELMNKVNKLISK